ncbi:hypothetical protein bcere0004_55070 [Bacillus cereus BGSC 6E1]|nr:hypothetical protein bcere0004_55070 [Bacillus cereus BGSC 6E1]
MRIYCYDSKTKYEALQRSIFQIKDIAFESIIKEIISIC